MTKEDITALYLGKSYEIVKEIDSSRGDDDVRRVYIAKSADGGRKVVIHEVVNTFTDKHRIASWARLEDEYNKLGIYCPRTVRGLDGNISYAFDADGGTHYVYAEEFAPYDTVETIGYDTFKMPDGRLSYQDDMMRSVGRVAEAHLDVCDFPSSYCLLEPFCSPDTTDEGTECAEGFRAFVNAELPEYAEQTERLLKLFYRAQDEVRKIYGSLPTSCFQADLNYSNILIDEGRFKGVIDFNLSGREPILNYTLRLALNYIDSRCYDSDGNELFYYDEDAESLRVESILRSMSVIGEEYRFTDAEKRAFPALLRYMKNFWWGELGTIKRLKKDGDNEKIELLLNWLERQLTRNDISL